MSPLIKNNLLISSVSSYIIIFVMITLAYITAFPPIFFFMVIILSLLITLFYYDDKNKVHLFLISLPVAKKKVVLSRYVAIGYLSIAFLFYQWLVMVLFSTSTHYVYGWQDIVTILSMTLIMSAIFIPFYYLFRSPHLATGIVLIIFFIVGISLLSPLVKITGMEDFIIFNDLDVGFSLLIKKYIPFLPYFFFLTISLIIFYISMKISQKIFIAKDRN